MSDALARLVVTTGAFDDTDMTETDGILIAGWPVDAAGLKKLADAAGKRPVRALLFGPVPRVHNYHVRQEGAFALAVRGISALTRQNVAVSALIPVTRSNHFLLPELIDLCARLGLRRADVVPAAPPAQPQETPQRWLGRYAVVAGDITAAAGRAAATHTEASVHTWPLCVPVGMAAGRTFDGVQTVFAPGTAYAGPLPLLRAGRYAEACERCARKDRCPGLGDAYVELYGGGEVVPFRNAE